MDELKRVLEEYDLMAHEPEIRGRMRPSIRLLHDEEATGDTIGGTRLGGVPDLPHGFEWPHFTFDGDRYPLSFMAQIDLAQLPRESVPAEMPTDGLLTFFYDAENQPWERENEPNGLVVVHHPSGTSLARTEGPADALTFPSLPVCCAEQWTLEENREDLVKDEWLYFKDVDFYAFDVEDEIRNAYRLDTGGDPDEEEPGPFHRIAGYDDSIQDPLIQRPEQVLLLQLDSDDRLDWMWGDVGRLYFFMTREDLASRSFDRVCFALQCS